jgi:hypothetical protein
MSRNHHNEEYGAQGFLEALVGGVLLLIIAIIGGLFFWCRGKDK